LICSKNDILIWNDLWSLRADFLIELSLSQNYLKTIWFLYQYLYKFKLRNLLLKDTFDWYRFCGFKSLLFWSRILCFFIQPKIKQYQKCWNQYDFKFRYIAKRRHDIGFLNLVAIQSWCTLFAYPLMIN
jgi:hypothetical protein